MVDACYGTYLGTWLMHGMVHVLVDAWYDVGFGTHLMHDMVEVFSTCFSTWLIQTG
jgi:hypothetical protein